MADRICIATGSALWFCTVAPDAFAPTVVTGGGDLGFFDPLRRRIPARQAIYGSFSSRLHDASAFLSMTEAAVRQQGRITKAPGVGEEGSGYGEIVPRIRLARRGNTVTVCGRRKS